MKIGLFFGSFNPIHIGHVAIANFMAGETDLEQVWLIVSPHNPHKDKDSLADDRQRLQAVKMAIGKSSKIKVCDIEFHLPQPSYTINTLRSLKKKFPRHKFVLIIGADNLKGFRKWKDYKKILTSHDVYVYPRSGPGPKRLNGYPNVIPVAAPPINVSSTFIRDQIKKGKDVHHLIPTGVRNETI